MATARRRIGIKDVAAAAGVSTTTVSHALSGKGRLPEATRESIAEIAAELGYRPNTSARNLVAGKTGLLGITVSASPDAPFGLGDFDYFIQLLSAATGAAVEGGQALVVEGAALGANAFSRVDIDGAIVIDPVSDDPLLASLDARGIPIVTTGRRDDGSDSGTPRHWIDNDHREATLSILDHLVEHGARRIGLVSTPPVTSYTRDAVAGYRSWCEATDQKPLVAVAGGPINEGSGFIGAAELLDGPDPPDAIYATLDQLALGVLLAARARSIAVPEELMVAGCTDSHGSAWAAPPLTAVALNPERIGRAAVAMLSSLIEGREPEVNPVMVPTAILPRQSTARNGPP
ncbi:MAG: LacI family DNA-binding transcriptional regulator [Solirubrobacterales bacterium]